MCAETRHMWRCVYSHHDERYEFWYTTESGSHKAAVCKSVRILQDLCRLDYDCASRLPSVEYHGQVAKQKEANNGTPETMHLPTDVE